MLNLIQPPSRRASLWLQLPARRQLSFRLGILRPRVRASSALAGAALASPSLFFFSRRFRLVCGFGCRGSFCSGCGWRNCGRGHSRGWRGRYRCGASRGRRNCCRRGRRRGRRRWHRCGASHGRRRCRDQGAQQGLARAVQVSRQPRAAQVQQPGAQQGLARAVQVLRQPRAAQVQLQPRASEAPGGTPGSPAAGGFPFFFLSSGTFGTSAVVKPSDQREILYSAISRFAQHHFPRTRWNPARKPKPWFALSIPAAHKGPARSRERPLSAALMISAIAKPS